MYFYVVTLVDSCTLFLIKQLLFKLVNLEFVLESAVLNIFCDNMGELRVGDISHENHTKDSITLITKVCTLPVHMRFVWTNLSFLRSVL